VTNVVAFLAVSVRLAMKQEEILLYAATQCDVSKQEMVALSDWMKKEGGPFKLMGPLERAALISELAQRARQPADMREMAEPIALLWVVLLTLLEAKRSTPLIIATAPIVCLGLPLAAARLEFLLWRHRSAVVRLLQREVRELSVSHDRRELISNGRVSCVSGCYSIAIYTGRPTKRLQRSGFRMNHDEVRAQRQRASSRGVASEP
jgi:hypothetical protein